MNNKFLNPINTLSITPPPNKINDLNLQLHAGSSVTNPYTFSIQGDTSFSGICELDIDKPSYVIAYGSKPWYYISWSEKSKVSDLTTIDGGAKFNANNITTMRKMFYDCTNLTSLNLSNLDTSKVINMCSAFYNCWKLTSLDVSNFNTSNVTDMSSMFEGCNYLASLNLSSFDTIKVTDMDSMFSNCDSLTSLDLSNFDTSNVTYMGGMFFGCKSLTSLNLSNFDTSKVTGVNSMFYNCNSLTSLNISNFNTSKVPNMYHMFYNCNNLKTLICSNGLDCSKAATLSEMFSGCPTFNSPLYLKNVKSSLIESGSSPSNWVVKDIGGTRGIHYIVNSVV